MLVRAQIALNLHPQQHKRGKIINDSTSAHPSSHRRPRLATTPQTFHHVTGKLCDARCTCTLNKNNAIISYQGTTVMEGIRKENGLWYLVTNQTAGETASKNQLCYQTCNDINILTHVYQAKRIKEAMQFLHAALWSPANAKLLQAIKAEFFASWPLLT